MHCRYATRSELWTWAALRENGIDALAVFAWRTFQLPTTRRLSLDIIARAVRTCTCLPVWPEKKHISRIYFIFVDIACASRSLKSQVNNSRSQSDAMYFVKLSKEHPIVQSGTRL